MTTSIRPIAVIPAEGAKTQALLRDFVSRWQGSHRIVGVIEEPRPGPDRECGPGWLRNIADGADYPIFQDLGLCSAGCTLDPAGVVQAAQAVRRDLAQDCDLVVISKFGKLEAENGSGLLSAVVAAIEAERPVLIAVSARYAQQWDRFAASYFEMLPANLSDIERWWRAIAGLAPVPATADVDSACEDCRSA